MNEVFKGECFNMLYFEMLSLLSFRMEKGFTIGNKDGHELSEIINPTIILENPKNCFAEYRDMSFKYLEGELNFYLSGSPYLKDIEKYSKFWKGVSDDDFTINSNYGRLLLFDRNSHNLTQFEYAKKSLQKNMESKKAVMVIYNKEHARKSNDNPCTMYLQFLYREDQLHLIVRMRSSDIWFGMPYDVPFFVFILSKMAKELNVEMGTYIHNTGSLHLYKRHFFTVYDLLQSKPMLTETDQTHLYNMYIESRLGGTDIYSNINRSN